MVAFEICIFSRGAQGAMFKASVLFVVVVVLIYLFLFIYLVVPALLVVAYGI